MKEYSSIIVTGSIAYDEIMDFPGKFKDHFHPEKLHQINVSFVVNRLEKQLGGIATNIAYNTSLIASKPIHLLSAIGRDGQAFIEFFTKHHIDTKFILHDSSTYTATGKVITDMGNNQIWGFYFGALAASGKLQLSPVLKDNATPLLIISPTHSDGFLTIQKQAITAKVPYVYDPGMALTWIADADLKKGVMNCRYLICNDYELAQIYRRLKITTEELTEKGISVITTLGENGSMYEDKYFQFKVPAVKLKKVVDPTGAGDAFRGGYFGALLEGNTIQDAMKIGNALASFAVEQYGTVHHAPTKKQIMERADGLKGK